MIEPTAQAELLVPLHALGEEDRDRAGGKAATLGRLARAGLAVPEGVVLTTAAAAAPLSAEVDAALAAVARRFGDAALAVRSSAVAEDLPGATFAGQYETVLGVRGLTALRDAVRRCWDSAHAARVLAYGRAHGLGGASPLAVLIQRQLEPDVAGVAFSADPVSGEERVRVSAVPGLGDGLVSGREQPDEWVVDGRTATAVRVVHQALTAEQAQAVAGLALRVAEVLGGPQDVEWAMADGRLLVLQARLVTALPRAPRADVPPGTWVKDAARHPEPLTALGASLAAPLVGDGLTAMQAAYGGLLERMEARSVGGELYMHAVPPGGREGAPPPWWALGLLARAVPALRRRMRTARRMVRPEVLAAQVDRWYAQWRPELQAEVAALCAVDLPRLDDRELDAHLGRAAGVLARGLRIHFHLIPPYVVPLHELVQTCAELLGWETPAALELLAGTSTATSEPARALVALAERIRRHPAARAAVERGLEDLAAADPELGAALAEWCSAYALRCVNNDPGSPVLAERPWLIARLLAEATAGPPSGEARERAAARARARLARQPPAQRARFERALAAALRGYPVREDTVFWAASMPAGQVRLAALEAGRRLVARGELGDPEDAVHLTAEQLRSALRRELPPGEARGLAARARAERAWTLQHPGPAFHGPPPSPAPDVRGLPRAARRLNAALLWSLGEERPRPAAGGEPVLTGLPASPGRHTGPVRIVRGEADFAALRAGDVLVAPTTDPAWSVLFATAGALVTDGGGVLSHAAIVAREHGIPAVVGTATATRELHDGDVVTVDGAAGRVLHRPDTGSGNANGRETTC